MDLGLTGKVALVTGGTRGIGAAIAAALQAEGCKVAVTGRDEAALAASSADLKVRADVLADECALAVETVRVALGPVDVLVNNVGGGGRWGDADPLKTEWNVWADVMEKNYGAALAHTRAALPGMVERGWGRVVTVASIAGAVEAAGRPWYVAAKAAECALMAALARRHVARAGVTFNSVAPGTVSDAGGIGEEEAEERAACVPRGRLATAAEVADVVVFLASERAAHVNGATIVVDGGESRAL